MSFVVSVKEKAQVKLCQLSAKEMNKSEPLMKCRNRIDDVKTRTFLLGLGITQGKPNYCLSGIRHRGGMNFARAFIWNIGTCRSNDKGESQVLKHKRKSTNVEHGGGITRSSDEVSVMEMERRGYVSFYELIEQLESKRIQ